MSVPKRHVEVRHHFVENYSNVRYRHLPTERPVVGIKRSFTKSSLSRIVADEIDMSDDKSQSQDVDNSLTQTSDPVRETQFRCRSFKGCHV